MGIPLLSHEVRRWGRMSMMEKRMINLLIIVLRAVVAVANAVIALLELIRELVD